MLFFSLFFFKEINIDFFILFFQGEKGLIENLTFFFLFVSIIITFSVIKKVKNFVSKKVYYFFVLFLLGLVYFSGEEISWGQNWFNWETNNFFSNINDQSETNFHNVSSWLDQKPRNVLICFILFAGIFSPFFLQNRKKFFKHSGVKDFILPTVCCLPTSIMCVFFYLLDKVSQILCSGTGATLSCEYFPKILFFRTSEIVELYISLFLLIYILSINLRLKFSI